MIQILAVVAEVGPGNERGGSVLVRVVVVWICHGAVLPRELMGRGGRRDVIVLYKQLAGGGHGAKGVVVVREEVKVEAELCSADAVCLCGEGGVVDVVLRGGGGVERELELLERLCLCGGDLHGGSCGDDGVRRPTPPLGKRRIEKVAAQRIRLCHFRTRAAQKKRRETGDQKKSDKWLI